MSAISFLSLVCFSLVVSSSYGDEPPEDMQKFLDGVKMCHEKHPSVPNATVEYAIVHDMAVPDEANEDARCFVECCMIHMGMLQSDGSFEMDKAVESMEDYRKFLHTKGKDLDVEALKKKLSSCSGQDGSGKCEKTYKFVKCGLENFDSIIKKL